MNMTIRVIAIICCLIVLSVSWFFAISSKSTAEKQLDLITQADSLVGDGVYILAAPLLEEAAGYDAAHTIAAEERLKQVYINLIDNRGFPRKYTGLLGKQMSRSDAPPEVFAEAANYYVKTNAMQIAFDTLKDGISRTGDPMLVTLYESIRYAYDLSRSVYDDVTAIYNRTAQVELGGKWGIANADGAIMIPCEYDKVSTFDQNRVVVKKDGVIYAVDKNNNRIAIAPSWVRDFRNFSANRIPLLVDNSWRRATGEFELGSNAFEDIGMYCEGYAAAKIDGKWGVIDIGSTWFIPAEYDEIILDELGRCYAQGAVFVRSGDAVYLYRDGERIGDSYQDAQPFYSEGYAAVKQNDKWGFIDTSGNLMIGHSFDDALSFGGHLAAVKVEEFWGYINIYSNLVIDAVFLDAKSFSNGSAPVLTDKGWQLITLIEYKKGGLLS